MQHFAQMREAKNKAHEQPACYILATTIEEVQALIVSRIREKIKVKLGNIDE